MYQLPSRLLRISSTMADSLGYWIPSSVLVHLLQEVAGSYLKEYLSFTLDRSFC